MSTLSYRTIAGPVVASIEEKRSVFECWLRPVPDEAAARAVVEEARVTHWDARHHCSAFVLGPDSAVVRSNDDGEPAGTAGMPMLEVLTGAGLTDVVAVVIRWFGGTLLGTGGLVRAYSQSVRAAVDEAQVRSRIKVHEVDVVIGHDVAGRLEHDLRARGLILTDVRYGSEVTLRVQVPLVGAGRVDVTELLAELTSGRARVLDDTAGQNWVDDPRG